MYALSLCLNYMYFLRWKIQVLLMECYVVSRCPIAKNNDVDSRGEEWSDFEQESIRKLYKRWSVSSVHFRVDKGIKLMKLQEWRPLNVMKLVLN